MRRLATITAFVAVFLLLVSPASYAGSKPSVKPTPYPPAVISLSIIPADRAAAILRGVYSDARIRVDRAANALIVVAPPDEESALRSVASGIDVKDPTEPTAQTIALRHSSPSDVASRLRLLYPNARFVEAPNDTLIIVAQPKDLAQINAIATAIDTPPATPTPKPTYPTETIKVTQGNPHTVARAVAQSLQNTRVSVSGTNILLSGPQDQLEQAKVLVAQLDAPQAGSPYTNVYRLRFVDATSVADLLQRSFSYIKIEVDTDLNAITVLADERIQHRIADAISQLDVGPQTSNNGYGGGASSGGGGSSDVVELAAAVPGQNNSPSTSAQDMAQTITTALQGIAPDLKITVPQNSTSLILTGSPYSIQQAKDLIAKLDVLPVMVVLDTEVFEVDDGAMKQLGLSTSGSISTAFTEVSPAAAPNGVVPPLNSLQPIGRTPLTLSAELDFLITTNQARILEDPRLTTISGRTASLRAGETYNVLTTTGGGTGVVATQQVQSFQTGVTLDITPVVNRGNYITISLHPSVNTNAGSSVPGGVPNIQTRDTTTTVGLHDGQTLVIGGLIEEDRSVSVTKLPILGDLPLIGGLFRNSNVNYARNELIITVTPHIVRDGENGLMNATPPLPAIPTAEPLPTLAPGTTLPPPRATLAARPIPEPAREPAPVLIPAPASAPLTPPPALPAGRVPQAAQTSASAAPNANATSNAFPTAFAQTNIFTYGAAPPNNFAQPQAPPQIYYVQVNPSVVQQGASMTISAITSTNVTRLSFGPSATLASTTISNIGPGKWQSTFPFSASGIMQSQGNVQMTLNAYTSTGAVSTIPIPISLVNQ